jgi:hypothetical protein
MVSLFSTTDALACFCVSPLITDNFQRSQFVAQVKILKVTPDSNNTDYHDAQIEVLTLYKGERLKKIKILSKLNSSCAFLPSANSTWIVFASVWQGILNFDYCSGSYKLDVDFNGQYPNATKNLSKSTMLKLQVLEYLSHHRIWDPNPSGLYAINAGLKTIKGFKNKDSFAVFQVDVNTDLSVNGVSILKKFQNNELTKIVFNNFKTDLKFVNPPHHTIPNPTRVIVFCYFYENQDPKTRESMVSLFDI